MVRVKLQGGDRCPDFTLAFHKAAISNLPFYSIIHTTSPYYVRPKREDPPVRSKRASRLVLLVH